MTTTMERPSEQVLQYLKYAVDRLDPSEVQVKAQNWLRSHAVTHLRVYYMHDNHTFTKLYGNQDEVVAQAHEISKESPCGMLTSVILMAGDWEQQRVGSCVHHRSATGLNVEQLAKWREETKDCFDRYPNVEQP